MSSPRTPDNGGEGKANGLAGGDLFILAAPTFRFELIEGGG